MNTTKTLQEAVQSAGPGDYINASFIATVQDVNERKTGTGKPFHVCKLHSGGNTVDCSSFDHDLRQFAGQEIHFGGKGMKRRPDYNGTPGISLGKGTLLAAVDGSQGQAQDPAPHPQKPYTASTTDNTGGIGYISVQYQQCLDAAGKLQFPNGLLPTSSDYQAAAATLFIEGNKRGIFRP